MQYISDYISPLGKILLAADDSGLTGLWFEGQAHYAKTLGADFAECEVPLFADVKHWLDCYFQRQQPDFMPPLHPRGTPFQQNVWQILLTIPYGQTATYGQIAARLAAQTGQVRMSAQAVGNAVGHNPISILIPCHRVLGAKGALTGYAGGVDKKQALLQMEGALPKNP